MSNEEVMMLLKKYKDLLADNIQLHHEVKQLREQQKKILEIAEINMALEWGDTDASFEWGYIIDMIKGYCTEIWEEEE